MDNVNHHLIQQLADELQPVMVENVATIDVQVELGVFDELMSMLLDAAEFRSSHNLGVTREELQAFAALLVLSRIGFVRARYGDPSIRKVKIIDPKTVQYPSFLYPLLQGIGAVYDSDLAIRFLPHVSWTIEDIEKRYHVRCNTELVRKVQDAFARLAVLGLQVIRCMPVAPEGSYGYVMCILAGQILSPSRKASPADAVCAAILKGVALESVVRYPFNYGSLTSFLGVGANLVERSFMRAPG